MTVRAVYLHLGWSMAHPFSPRRWTVEEWRRWVDQLPGAGVNRLVLWPMFELIGPEPDAGERDWLEVLRAVRGQCRARDMEFFLGSSPNAAARPSALAVPFADRDARQLDFVHPEAPEFKGAVLEHRLRLLQACGGADGWWWIDGDPGVSLGTAPSAFARLVADFDRLATPSFPALRTAYWMWGGWTDRRGEPAGWRERPQDYWSAPARLLLDSPLAPRLEFWCCWPGHAASLPAGARALSFPYNRLEPEPSIPWTAHDGGPAGGDILNLQTPCLRTPALFGEEGWEAVERRWCWSAGSLERIRPAWRRLSGAVSALEADRADPSGRAAFRAALAAWRDLTGFRCPARRGLLRQLAQEIGDG